MSCIKSIFLPILFIPVFLGSSTRPFPGVAPCDEAHSIEIYQIASIVYCECRGESHEGKVAVISAVRNGARGYCTGRLDDSLVRLVAREMKKPISHPYKHWINLELATDTRQVRIAKKAIREGKALKILAQWFY